MNTRVLGALIVLLLYPAADALAAPALAMAPLGYRIESVTPVSGAQRTYDVTARAGVYNTGDPATSVTAQLLSSSAQITIADGNLSFGNVSRVTRLNPVISTDTFKLRVTVPRPHTFLEAVHFARTTIDALSWRISCGNCGGNRPPVANAGANQTSPIGQAMTLDGSASTDPDGDPLRFTWTVVSAPAGVSLQIANASSVRPSTVLPARGTYVVRLIVNDGITDSAPSTVTLTTANTAPVANAGLDQTAAVGATVRLSGAASSDVDGDALTYEWQLLEVPASSAATVLNADPANPAADFAADRAGRYVAQLTVRDALTASTPDSVIVSTVNSPPVARAGADRTARIGDWVEVSGGESSDADADPLTYRWSLTAPSGSSAALSSSAGPVTGFSPDVAGVYVVQLLVNDGSVDSEADTVAVSTANSRPIADAGANLEVFAGSRVDLDGIGSSDPDGDPLSFAWSLISIPPESATVLQDATSPTPYFVADVAGTFVAQLVVSDGNFDSTPSTTQVSVRVIDNEGPHVVIDTPLFQSFANSRRVRFSGYMSEPGELWIAGIAFTLDIQNRFDREIELSEGLNRVDVTSLDAAGNTVTAFWVVTVDTQAPPQPRAQSLSKVSLPNGMLRVLGSAGAVELHSTVRITNLRTGLSVTATADGDGTFDAQIAGLEADSVSIVVIDAAANQSSAVRLDTVGGEELRIEIAAPLDGATVADRFVAVRGQLFGPADAAISVNNQAAALLESGARREFFATVAIQDGENLIEVVAARPNGVRISHQVRVIRAGAGAFSVTAVPDSGIAPFDVLFEISQFERGEILGATVDLGNGTPEILSEGDDRYIAGRYELAGAFNSIVTITTADGQVISSSVPIIVLDRAQVDLQIQRVWGSVRAALEAGDAESALQLFAPDAAERYRPAFTAPGVNLPALAANLGEIFPANIDTRFADYIITTNSSGVAESFLISFMRVQGGGWRLTTL
jgi:hypothetical protein